MIKTFIMTFSCQREYIFKIILGSFWGEIGNYCWEVGVIVESSPGSHASLLCWEQGIWMERKCMGFGVGRLCAWTLAFPLTSCVNPGKTPILVWLFLHRYRGDDTTYFITWPISGHHLLCLPLPPAAHIEEAAGPQCSQCSEMMRRCQVCFGSF